MSAEDNAPTVALPNAHVYEYLNYYIDFPHPPHYAVLLDGPWGIGKTHLIKKFLEDKFREDVDNLWKTKKSRLAKIFQRNRSKADRANFTYVSLFDLALELRIP